MQRRKDTLMDWILNVLEECQPARLTAREIAARLIAKYPDHYAKKEAKMTGDRDIEGQVAAEVGSRRQWLLKVDARLSRELETVMGRYIRYLLERDVKSVAWLDALREETRKADS